MRQNKIFEFTKKARELPLRFTYSAIEKSKKLYKPSSKVDKVGTAIGSCVGTCLLFAGIVQLFVGKPLWALGIITTGTITIVSNHYHRKNIKE